MSLFGFKRSFHNFINWLLHPANTQERNIRNVLIDGIGVGIVSGVSTFLAVFLARLGASPFLVGLLTAMPALTGIMLAIPAGRLLERQRNIVPWFSRARLWVLGSNALTGLVPFFIPLEYAPITIILIWAVATFPQTIVNVAFTMVMGAVAGPNHRFSVMSRRWSTLGITSALTVALIGWLLEQFSFPANYQYVFIGSFLGGLVSFMFSSRLDIPDNDPVEQQEAATKQPLPARIAHTWQTLRGNQPYTRLLISQFVYRFGWAMPMPLFPLYWVRELEISDSWIGLINTIQSAVLLGAYFLWAELSRRKSPRLVLVLSSMGLSLYPLLTSMTSSPLLLMLYAGMSGVFTAGMDLVLFDMLLSTCPPRHNASYIALYQTTTHIATFVAPLLGTFLVDTLSFGPAFLTSAGIRLTAAILFVALGVGKVAATVVQSTTQPETSSDSA
jgi:MFS family permease